jgi:hypothetical protein
MPVLLILTILVQAFFIYHVFKTGRPYWWAFVILVAPMLGSLVYYLVEVFPNSRQQRSARKKGRELIQVLQPDAELKRRTEELEICGSLDNKLALARECEAAGMYDEAVRLYKSCLAGAYADDAQTTLLLARAQLLQGDYSNAEQGLNHLQSAHPDFKPLETRLLQARVLEKNGDARRALALYESLLPVYSGLEVKCRYASLLKSLGHTTQAVELFAEVIQHAKRFNITHEEEKNWANFARSQLK